MPDKERKRVVGDAYEMDALIARMKDQAQRIAELEAENATYDANLHAEESLLLNAGFGSIQQALDANATLTAQLGTARAIGAEMDAQMPCSTDEIGCPCCCIAFPMVVRLLAALGTARDGAEGGGA